MTAAMMWRVFCFVVAAVSVHAAPVTLEDLLGELDMDAVTELTGLKEAEIRATARQVQQWMDALGLELDLDYVLPVPSLRLPAAAPPVPPAAPPWGRATDRSAAWPAAARMWVPRLKPVFVAAGVPAELVWMAHVESRFNPSARSQMGAVGLFQLMPGTAELLGLATAPQDERLDPEKNARAAAEYLHYLYGKFGDWRLTVAAYNGGEGRVRRLLEKRAGRTFDAIATGLPTETRIYVLRVEAAVLTYEGMWLSELAPAVSSFLVRQ